MSTVELHPLELFVEKASALPAMPEVALQLLQSLDRDTLTIPELAALVGRDQALAGKVLRLANSPRYSPARTVGTINDAAVALGLRTLRDLTLSASMVGAFPEIKGFDRVAFWRGSMGVASYAQVLAKAVGVEEDMAYLGGLMLRTGQILILMADPDMAVRLERVALEPDSRFSFEQTRLGCTHAEITAALARHWRFPDVLVEAFGTVAMPMEAKPFSRLGGVLRLASVITDARERGQSEIEVLQATQADLMTHLRLEQDWLVAHLPDHRLATAAAEALLH